MFPWERPESAPQESSRQSVRSISSASTSRDTIKLKATPIPSTENQKQQQPQQQQQPLFATPPRSYQQNVQSPAESHLSSATFRSPFARRLHPDFAGYTSDRKANSNNNSNNGGDDSPAGALSHARAEVATGCSPGVTVAPAKFSPLLQPKRIYSDIHPPKGKEHSKQGIESRPGFFPVRGTLSYDKKMQKGYVKKSNEIASKIGERPMTDGGSRNNANNNNYAAATGKGLDEIHVRPPDQSYPSPHARRISDVHIGKK